MDEHEELFVYGISEVTDYLMTHHLDYQQMSVADLYQLAHRTLLSAGELLEEFEGQRSQLKLLAGFDPRVLGNFVYQTGVKLANGDFPILDEGDRQYANMIASFLGAATLDQFDLNIDGEKQFNFFEMLSFARVDYLRLLNGDDADRFTVFVNDQDPEPMQIEIQRDGVQVVMPADVPNGSELVDYMKMAVLFGYEGVD